MPGRLIQKFGGSAALDATLRIRHLSLFVYYDVYLDTCLFATKIML